MERQIRKRQGLYIKKDNTLLKSVSLKDFSFENICEHSLLFHDNPNANLIYQKYHEQEDLDAAIKPHPGLQSDVRDPDSIVPILQPLDFTADWRRQQDRASKRSKGRLEEEDEFELELEIARRKEEEAALRKAAEEGHSAPQENIEAAESEPSAPEQTASPEAEEPQQAPADDEEKIVQEIRNESDGAEESDPRDAAFKAQKNNLDTVGEVIKTLNDGTPEEQAALSETNEDGTAVEQATADNTDAETVAAPENESQEFIPVSADHGAEPEKAAMEEYETKQIQKEDKYKKVFDEAKSSGYEAGFKEGEAKGVAQLQDLTGKVTSNVSDLLSELGSLKRNILESAEENFMQVCQALAESLLEHEFSVNPEAFKAVIRKAISDAMPDDKFTVKVHPAFLEHLQKTDLGELEGRIFGDESIEPGSFKVESDLSSIEGDMKQIVSDLLQAGQSEIFAKKTEEAG